MCFVNFQTIITIGMFNTSVFFLTFSPILNHWRVVPGMGHRRVQGADTQNGVLVGLSRHPTILKT
jgi:hypothetical protein